MLYELDGKHEAGFSLVEMAVVLFIIGLLLGGMLMPLSAQMEQQKIQETRKTLDMAKEALLGYAAANGRLPCPASSTSNGSESFAAGGNNTNGNCSNFFDGYLPAVTLGLSPLDSQGYLTDGWGLSQNRIRYAVSNQTVGITTNPLTTSGGMRSVGMTALAGQSQYLTVCRANSTQNDCGGGGNLQTQSAPVVLYSLGKNATTGGTGADEAQNLNANLIFVSREMSGPNAPNGEFDDILTWFSMNTLFSRMLAAGSLP